MTKLLLIVVVIFVVYALLKSYKKKNAQTGPQSSARPEDMVRCAQCGVHLPRSESLMTEQLFYCSAEHRRLHQHAD